MKRGLGRHRPSTSHEPKFRAHPGSRPRERERDYPPLRHNSRGGHHVERDRHRRTFSAPGRGHGEPLLQSPRLEPPDRRDVRPSSKMFDPASRSSVHQLRVGNLFVKRGHIDDRQLRNQVHDVFGRFGKCSVRVEPVGSGDDREAIVSYWSSENLKAGRREGDGMMLNGRRLEASIARDSFGGGAGNQARQRPASYGSPSHGESRRDSGHSMTSPAMPARSNDDDTATRTLFVGGLEPAVNVSKVKEHFAQVGPVHDIEVKRARLGATYGFVKFVHMRDARRAKVELQGSLILKSRIHLGYGRGTPSCKLYTYNLGRWASKEILDQAFGRFGALRSMDYRTGSTFAIVEYEQMEYAKNALRGLKRVRTMDGLEYPIAVSYIDAMDLTVMFRDQRARHFDDGVDEGPPSERGLSPSTRAALRGSGGGNVEDARIPMRDYRHSDERTSSRVKREHSHGRDDDQKRVCVDGGLSAAQGSEPLAEVARRCPVVWRGGLALRDACCPVRLHALGGDASVAEDLLCRLPVPRVLLSQKMQLQASKLDEVLNMAEERRHCWLLGLPTVHSETLALQSEIADHHQRQGNLNEAGDSAPGDCPETGTSCEARGADQHVSMESGAVEGSDGSSFSTASPPADSCAGEKMDDGEPASPRYQRSPADAASDEPASSGRENVQCQPSSVAGAGGGGSGDAAPVQWRAMTNFGNYMRAKQCAGIGRVRPCLPLLYDKQEAAPGSSACSGVLHVFPPSEFADGQLALLNPTMATPVDGMLLCLLVADPSS